LEIFARKEIGSEFVVDNRIILDRLETISSRQQKSFVFATPVPGTIYFTPATFVSLTSIASSCGWRFYGIIFAPHTLDVTTWPYIILPWNYSILIPRHTMYLRNHEIPHVLDTRLSLFLVAGLIARVCALSRYLLYGTHCAIPHDRAIPMECTYKW